MILGKFIQNYLPQVFSFSLFRQERKVKLKQNDAIVATKKTLVLYSLVQNMKYSCVKCQNRHKPTRKSLLAKFHIKIKCSETFHKRLEPHFKRMKSDVQINTMHNTTQPNTNTHKCFYAVKLTTLAKLFSVHLTIGQNLFAPGYLHSCSTFSYSNCKTLQHCMRLR